MVDLSGARFKDGGGKVLKGKDAVVMQGLYMLAWAIGSLVDPEVEALFPKMVAGRKEVLRFGLKLLNSIRVAEKQSSLRYAWRWLTLRSVWRLEQVGLKFDPNEIENAASFVERCIADQIIYREQAKRVWELLDALVDDYMDATP